MKPVVKLIVRWIAVVFLVGVVLALAGFLWWGMHPLGPKPGALAALQSDDSVRVTHAADGWEFSPTSGEATAALIYYPGGHVDARSYAPYAHDLARRGYLVVIPVMPLSLAVLSSNAADRVVKAHPGISHWVIGGHSLGGVMAAHYVAQHPGAMRGLVLFGSYPASGDDLSRSGIAVLTEVGTLDRGMNRASLAAGRKLLPPTAVYWDLQGGNHAQFGDYGLQPGDDPNPTMSAAAQRLRAVEGSIAVLRTP